MLIIRRSTSKNLVSCLRIKIGITIFLALLFAGCGSSDNPPTKGFETPTSYELLSISPVLSSATPTPVNTEQILPTESLVTPTKEPVEITLTPSLLATNTIEPAPPIRLEVITEFVAENFINKIFLTKDLIYLVNREIGLITVLNSENPISPAKIGTFTINRIINQIAVADNFAFIESGDSGFEILDISGITQPLLMGHLDHEGDIADIALAGQLLYRIGFPGLQAINFDNPSIPEVVSTLNIHGHTLVIEDSNLYVIGGTCNEEGCKGELIIFDISSPSEPSQISKVNIPGAAGMAVVNGFVYIASDCSPWCSMERSAEDITDPPQPHTPRVLSELWVVNAIDPANPQVVNILTSPEQYRNQVSKLGDKYIYWGRDYVENGYADWGGEIFEISFSDQPRLVGTFNEGGGFVVSNELIYASTGNKLLILKLEEYIKP